MSNKYRGDFWPTKQQLLLLNAALKGKDEAISAWNEWQSNNHIDLIDAASHRLMPLVYLNLHNYGVKHKWIERMKGLYRHTWTYNQCLLALADNVILALKAQGIDSLLLKGSALTLLYYKNYGARLMGDADLLVPIAKVNAAMEVLEQIAIRPMFFKKEQINQSVLDNVHGTAFRAENGMQIDLHWQILPELCRTSAASEIFARAGSAILNSHQVLVLSPEDNLIQICVHGAKQEGTSLIRWIPDCYFLLKELDHKLDWDYVVASAAKYRIALPLVETFSYLNDYFQMQIPSEVINRLKAVSLKSTEIYAYTFNKRRSLFILPFSLWYRYLRIANEKNIFCKYFGFIAYLKAKWHCQHVWQFPVYIVKTAVRIFKQKRVKYEPRQ